MPYSTAPTAGPADTGIVCWPEPSPLDGWWTEVMDGVTPARARDTVSALHLHDLPTSPSRRSPA